MRTLLTCLTLCFASILPADAQADGLFSMQSREDGRAWEAVGRLELGGKAFCTGALIAENLVLTAAHCLFDIDTGQQIPVSDIQFLAGWRNGRAAAYRRVRRAVAHPDFDVAAESGPERVRSDVALIELQLPIRNTTITPFATGAQPRKGTELSVVSYAHDRSEAPSLQGLCKVLARQKRMLVLSCQVDFGSSGSPVFATDGEVIRIVSVISAKAEARGREVSLGADLENTLDTLRAALDRDTVVRQPLDAGMRRDTGAKFVRP